MILYYITWYFLIYAFIGWCTEVVYAAVCHGKFVNRGFLCGPLCPIYGFGAVIVVSCLTPVTENTAVLFIASALLTSILEFITGFVLERVFHAKWWDYSDVPFNIMGYVCLKFSLLWGVACVLLMRVLHPSIASVLEKIPYTYGVIILAVLCVLLACDVTVTVIALSSLRSRFVKIDRAQTALRRVSDKLGSGLSDEAILLKKAGAAAAELIDKKYGDAGDRLAVHAEELSELLDRSRRSLNNKTFLQRKIFKAFPNLGDKYKLLESTFTSRTEALKEQIKLRRGQK